MRTKCEALEPCAASAGCPRGRRPRGPQGAPPPSAPRRDPARRRTRIARNSWHGCSPPSQG
eukprot:606302-Pyramimonas_sp.AAC.1